MTDPGSPEFWDAMEAREVVVWLSEGTFGLWCPTCLLPSAYATQLLGSDPAMPAGCWMWQCSEDNTHRPADNWRPDNPEEKP